MAVSYRGQSYVSGRLYCVDDQGDACIQANIRFLSENRDWFQRNLPPRHEDPHGFQPQSRAEFLGWFASGVFKPEGGDKEVLYTLLASFASFSAAGRNGEADERAVGHLLRALDHAIEIREKNNRAFHAQRRGQEMQQTWAEEAQRQVYGPFADYVRSNYIRGPRNG
jgi:hypothetical protein